MTKEEFGELLGNSEKRRIEFKGKINFKDFKEHFSITLISMANIIGGGIIVVGVNNDAPHKIEGLSEEELNSFEIKKVYDYLKNKVSPLPVYNSEIFPTQNGNVLIFYVKEFNDVPHIIKNNIEYNGKKYLPGDVIIRTESSESRRIQDENEMRELIGLSMKKRSELLLNDIKGVMTGKFREPEIFPEDVFNIELVKFKERAESFLKRNEKLVFLSIKFVPNPLVSKTPDIKKHFTNSIFRIKQDSFPLYENDVSIIYDSLILDSDKEYWRLSNNLCFGIFKAFSSEQLEANHPSFPYPAAPDRPILADYIIRDLLGVFAFYRSLISSEEVDSIWISVELCNTKNRYIKASNSHPLFNYEVQKCLSDKIITPQKSISKGVFIASNIDYSNEISGYILKQFQMEISKDQISKIQKDFLDGKF